MRTDFITFLSEETKGKALKHLRHVEDYVVHGGHDGVAVADEHLRGMHDMLLGKKSSLHASTKYDGAPSIVFGTHPQNGQFFVASKSAFNKSPKINFTDEDIDRNHGHIPDLASKLKQALRHLPGIMPRTGGVYQGDLMHSKTSDVTKKGNMSSITPNTLTYSAPSNSPEGRNMKKALGVVVHTKYTGKGGLESMSAQPLDHKTRAQFKEHPDVNNIDPTIEVNPSNYSTEEQRAFLNHMDKAKRHYASMKPEGMDAIAGHGDQLEMHVNNMIKTGGTPSVEGYMDHLTDRHNKDLENLKTEKGRQNRIQAHGQVLSHISNNRDSFAKALKVHEHLGDAKNILTNVLAKNSKFQHSVAGESTGPEGTVVVDKQGNASKFNNRREFNRLNFLKGAFQKQQVANAEAQLQ